MWQISQKGNLHHCLKLKKNDLRFILRIKNFFENCQFDFCFKKAYFKKSNFLEKKPFKL